MLLDSTALVEDCVSQLNACTALLSRCESWPSLTDICKDFATRSPSPLSMRFLPGYLAGLRGGYDPYSAVCWDAATAVTRSREKIQSDDLVGLVKCRHELGQLRYLADLSRRGLITSPHNRCLRQREQKKNIYTIWVYINYTNTF